MTDEFKRIARVRYETALNRYGAALVQVHVAAAKRVAIESAQHEAERELAAAKDDLLARAEEYAARGSDAVPGDES